MPEHLAKNANTYNGRVSMINTKVAIIYIINEEGQQVYFNTKPFWSFTQTGSSVANIEKTQDIKAGNLFAGVKISTGSNVTMDIEWRVSK